ncbi:MAG: hypothetical protein WCF16_08985 [Alphaproteobacteria bacterium]
MAAPRPRAAVRKARGSVATAWAAAVMGVMMILALPSFVVIVVGMIPALVAFFIDRTRNKYFGICVAGMNFAGVMPFLAQLWHGHNSVGQALAILANVYAWLAMYGAAGAGWLLYLCLPAFVESFLRIRSKKRISDLTAARRELEREWGVGSPPPDEMPVASADGE